MKTHKYFIFMVGRTVLTQPLQQQGHSDFPYHPSIPTIYIVAQPATSCQMA